jgi:hypothetical protein
VYDTRLPRQSVSTLMKDLMKFFLITIFSFFLVTQVAAEPILPPQPAFWKSKAKVHKKIREERAIIVSVLTKKSDIDPKKPHLLHMTGGGWIGTSRKFAYDQARDFSNLKKVSSHIREVVYNAKDQTLYLHTEAFNYHAKMKLKVDFKEVDSSSQIDFTVIEGMFVCLQGLVTFSEVEPLKSEIGFFSGYRYKDLPMPRFFIEFGLEVVIQKISGFLRGYIENEFSKAKRQATEDKK